VKVCDKTCIFFFFPIINKYFLMAKRSLLSRCPSYSPRRSIHFLVRCSDFYKPLKKKFRMLSVQPGLRDSNDLRDGRKMATLQFFFLVQGTGGSPTGPGPDPESRVGDQDTGSRGRPVSSGGKCPVSRGIFVQEQDHLDDLPAAFFLQNVLQLQQQR